VVQESMPPQTSSMTSAIVPIRMFFNVFMVSPVE
jgi:hypothetical protein